MKEEEEEEEEDEDEEDEEEDRNLIKTREFTRVLRQIMKEIVEVKETLAQVRQFDCAAKSSLKCAVQNYCFRLYEDGADHAHLAREKATTTLVDVKTAATRGVPGRFRDSFLNVPLNRFNDVGKTHFSPFTIRRIRKAAGPKKRCKQEVDEYVANAIIEFMKKIMLKAMELAHENNRHRVLASDAAHAVHTTGRTDM